jgi:hypothetical protein
MEAAADTGSAASSWAAPATGATGDPLEEHPEFLVAGAFAGGLALALALRWLGRGDD